ncbi:MAG: SdrD B-like domain-containing protein, partial [Bacillota bacterium]
MRHRMTPGPLTRPSSLPRARRPLARAVQPLAPSRLQSRPIESLEPRLFLAAASEALIPDPGPDAACISVVSFLDRDANGKRDAAREEGLAGWTVFLDANSNGQLDAGERSAITDPEGLAEFDPVPPGAYRVTQVPCSSWIQTGPVGGTYSVFVNSGEVRALAFGNAPKSQPILAAMGAELPVPTMETGQTAPVVAMDGAGSYVVAWQDYTGAIYGDDIFAQRFDATGQRLGSEIRVNAYRRGSQNQPTVAMDSDGDFVVAWSSADSGHGGVFAQRFDAQGQPVGSEFRVSAKVVNADQQPAIAMEASGSFVITWMRVLSSEDTDIYARQFDAAGVPQSGDLSIATAVNLESCPDVAMTSDGGFIVTWQGEHATSETDIYARRYSSTGAPRGEQFQVNSFTSNRQSRPAIVTAQGGEFVVAWESDAQDGDGAGIYAQRYNAAGQRQGGEFHVSTTTRGAQEMPDIAMAGNGGFVITWSSPQTDGSGSIYAQQYTAAGEKVSNEVRVNSYTLTAQSDPAMAMNGHGDAIIAWSSSAYANERSPGIYAQRYASIVGSATVGGVVWKDADGDGLQDPEETGMAGVTVNLLSGAGQFLTSINSSDDGRYRFEGLQPNESYVLEFVVPFDWTVSERDQGAEDTLDSDVDLITARTAVFTPAPAQIDLHQDAGLMQMASVRGLSFNDLDGDGVRDPGDPGIADRTIYIDANGNGQRDAGELSVKTDPDGTYRLENLRPGVYRIGQVAQDAWKSTGSADGFCTVSLVPGQWLEGVDFGSQSLMPMAHPYPLGSEVLVSQPGDWAAYNSFTPSVAMNAAGDSVAVWQVYYYPDHDTCGVYAQRYNAAGVAQGDLFYVVNSVDDGEMLPVVAMDDAGNVVVAWQDQTHIDARRYSAADDSWGEAFRVDNDDNMWEMASPAVAMDPAGDFIIAWQGRTQIASEYNIFALRYDSEGMPEGEMLLINDCQECDQTSPSVAMDAAGNFIVAWERQEEQSSEECRVYARRFTAAGDPMGDAFRVTD